MGRAVPTEFLGIVFSLSSEGVVVTSRQRLGATPGSDPDPFGEVKASAANCPHAGLEGAPSHGTLFGGSGWLLLPQLCAITWICSLVLRL